VLPPQVEARQQRDRHHLWAQMVENDGHQRRPYGQNLRHRNDVGEDQVIKFLGFVEQLIDDEHGHDAQEGERKPAVDIPNDRRQKPLLAVQLFYGRLPIIVLIRFGKSQVYSTPLGSALRFSQDG
jgi:hypothetical protein